MIWDKRLTLVEVSVTLLLQETFILLDLIGTSDTRFRERFPQTASVYRHLQNIGENTVSVQVDCKNEQEED